MRAVILIVALAAFASSARAEKLFTFGGGYQLSSGNEAGVAPDMSTVAYPFERNAVQIQFDGEIDDVLVTDRGGTMGLHMHGNGLIVTSYKRTTETGEMEPADAKKFRFMIGGGPMVPIVKRGAWRLDGHFSLEWYFTDQLAIASGLRLRRIVHHAVTRLQYDVRPFWLGANRLEHELTVGLGVSGFGVRASATLGEDRDRSGGYRSQTFTIGVEVVR